MTNGEDGVMRVLEDAVSAATGSEHGVADVMELAGMEEGGDPAVAPPAQGEKVIEFREWERKGGERTSEGTLGIQSRLEPLAGMESLAGAAPGKSAISKAVSWMNPLVGGLVDLIGSDRTAPATGPAKAIRPGRVNYEAGFGGSGGGLVEMDRDESGRLRDASPMAQVVVNVDAMDSRSFLDRTPEIAEAVQRALLESGSIRRLMHEE